MLGFRKKSLIGLDIDTYAVRMIQLRPCEGASSPAAGAGGTPSRYAITGACIQEILPWGDSPELRRMHTVCAIQQGLSGGAIEGGLAVCGLRGREVVVRGFEFPALPSEEIEGAVALEASQICPFSTDESTLDYQVTSSDGKKTRGFWVAANNGLIHTTRELVHEAGLHCSLIDVDGLALLNCLANMPDGGGEADDGVIVPPPTITARGEAAILDVGGACTTVAIRDQAGRPFVRDIASGSDDILRRIAADTGVSLEVARTALLNRGWEGAPNAESRVGEPRQSVVATLQADTPDQERAHGVLSWETPALPEDEDRLWRGLERACAELIEAIATTLRYHAAQQSCERVERLLVCGALAAVDEFIELLRAKLYIEVASWNPLAALPCEAGAECQSLVRAAGATLVVAAGLAMRQL